MKELFESIGGFLLICAVTFAGLVLSAVGTVFAGAFYIVVIVAAVIIAVCVMVALLIAVLFSPKEKEEGKDND